MIAPEYFFQDQGFPEDIRVAYAQNPRIVDCYLVIQYLFPVFLFTPPSLDSSVADPMSKYLLLSSITYTVFSLFYDFSFLRYRPCTLPFTATQSALGLLNQFPWHPSNGKASPSACLVAYPSDKS